MSLFTPRVCTEASNLQTHLCRNKSQVARAAVELDVRLISWDTQAVRFNVECKHGSAVYRLWIIKVFAHDDAAKLHTLSESETVHIQRWTRAVCPLSEPGLICHECWVDTCGTCHWHWLISQCTTHALLTHHRMSHVPQNRIEQKTNQNQTFHVYIAPQRHVVHFVIKYSDTMTSLQRGSVLFWAGSDGLLLLLSVLLLQFTLYV